MVELLSESYNPHVRYGSAMALGISCAGTGLDEAIDLLEPMMKDPTDFYRPFLMGKAAAVVNKQLPAKAVVDELVNDGVAWINKGKQMVVAKL
ncbi:26S proteasome non-ATPase regulatory subunit 1 like protein [Verticillium longisporum]|nr:26S proteasome non-ATPase regulatory subunit 1 like protein [Verticillium longisporum]